jgi:two-component system sensor histidine kinase SenX3
MTVAVLLVLLAVTAGLLVRAVVARRAVERRLEAVAGRLEEAAPGPDPGPEGQPAAVRLERAAAAVSAGLEDAGVTIRRLAGALDAVSHGVVVCDPAGREVFRNRAAARFAGSRQGAALVERAVQEQLRAGRAGTAQPRVLELYGPPPVALAISAVPLEQPGGTGAVAVVDDVSERRRLEGVRRDFVANMGHELKTPVGALGLLADAISSEDDPAVTRRLADRMAGEAVRVGRIVDDLLDLSRIEAEEVPRREPVPVHLVVAEAVERARPLAGARRITIDTAGVSQAHTVSGDRRQLVSAVENLLDNACKYSDDGSTVEIRSRAAGAAVEVDVQDSGIGIPARDLERVFERFYRVDPARSRQTGGTGLGLSIVRHVAGNHGGDVRVVSREGEGSTFTLRLPSTADGAGPTPGATAATAAMEDVTGR